QVAVFAGDVHALGACRKTCRTRRGECKGVRQCRHDHKEPRCERTHVHSRFSSGCADSMLHADESRSGVSATARSINAPVTRTMGFSAAFFVMGRLGKDQVIQVNPAVSSTNALPAKTPIRRAPASRASATARIETGATTSQMS